MGFGAGGSVDARGCPRCGPAKGTYGWGGAAGTIAWVDPARHARGTIMVNYMPPERLSGAGADGKGAADGLCAVETLIAPGFTGSPLDRADHLRRDPDALAAAKGDWRARLLRLDQL